MRHLLYAFVALCLTLGILLTDALALDNIIRPYQSVRSSGMGGVTLTTGLYDENFFGNPARVTDNPVWRLTLFDVSAEANSNTISTVSKITKSDGVKQLGDMAGENTHGRIQTAFPALYIPHLGHWSYGFGILSSTQFDLALRRSYRLEPGAISDIGPAFNFGRTFLKDKRLAVGMTPHLTYRVASNQDYSLIDYFQGKQLNPTKGGGNGTHLDFDLGTEYEFPFRRADWHFHVAGAVNNILGGNYRNAHFKPYDLGPPPPQPRSFGVGFSGTRDHLLFLHNIMAALEFRDIGNNPNGSLFRTVHIGGEGHWKLFSIRAGINQGYWAAGLGINLAILQINLASYGEEMTLNPGGMEDRRYALNLSIQI